MINAGWLIGLVPEHPESGNETILYVYKYSNFPYTFRDRCTGGVVAKALVLVTACSGAVTGRESRSPEKKKSRVRVRSYSNGG